MNKPYNGFAQHRFTLRVGMSSSSKRRKVTVDIKQTKLERGSVFARLGNKEKHRKKNKSDPDAVTKPKKDIVKPDIDTDEVKKKTKSSRSDEVTPTKKIKEYPSSRKQKVQEHEQRESRKSHRRSQERQTVENVDSQNSRSKRKSEKKMENVIIEKRMSPMLIMSEEPSRSTRSRSPSSLSPKKKSKKHRISPQDVNKYLDHSPSPERSESRKHRERGRSREKKKTSKDSKKSKEFIEPVELDSRDVPRHTSKPKKSSKHKPEKYQSEEIVIDKKSSKTKSSRDHSKDHEKHLIGKISPVVYDASSDDQHGKRHEKDPERSNKSKRRKHETESQCDSPARHKKSKRHVDADEEGCRKDSSLSRSHLSKKRNHKDDDAPKKKSHKEDSAQLYSDFSPMSKVSQAEYSEMSQASTANDDRYSSDATIEKESKRRSKSKKKTKKDFDSSSKPHYEVIDDDYSDDGKKDRKDHSDDGRRDKKDYCDDGKRDKKKRKRKRNEDDYEESPDELRGYEDRTQKSSHIRPPEKVRHTEKYLSPHDGGDLFKRKSSPHISTRRDTRIDRTHEGVKQERREHHEKYRETHKGYNRDVRDRRKDDYDEMKNPRDMRFSPERREPGGFVQARLPDRHFSAEKNSHKVMDWHHDNAKRLSGDRNENIPRLMSMPHDQDRRAEGSRSSVNKYPLQRKRSDQEYQDQYHDDHTRPGVINSERNVIRPNDRRLPPPLLPPSFDRSATPSNSRDNHGYMDNNRFGNNVRKFEKTRHRDGPPQLDVRNRKHMPPVHDEYNERPSRSGSHDSRSSHHTPLGMQGKNRNLADSRSPQTDRNSSRERKDSRKVLMDGSKYTKEREYEGKHSRSRERTIKLIKNDDVGDRGPGERVPVRPLKRHRDESSGSRRSTPSQDRSKKRRTDTREDKSPSSQRTKKETTKAPTKEYDRKQKSDRKSSSRKSHDHAKTDAKKPAATESYTPEVDWNELQSSPKSKTVPKEKSQVLSKFTPGSILQRTGIIMCILPEHLINRINKTNSAKQKETAENQNSSIISNILRNGLNSYSDEKLRKYLLGYNIENKHEYYPPSIINGRTYVSSMKMYIRKGRMVEPL